jgi:hypothetical protein
MNFHAGIHCSRLSLRFNHCEPLPCGYRTNVGYEWNKNKYIKVGTIKFIWHQLFGSSNITNKNDAEFSVSTMWTWDLLTTTIIFPNFPHISRSLLRGSEQNDGVSGRFQVLRRSQTKACCPIEHTWKCPRRSGGPVGWSLMTWMMVLWCLDISGYPILWLIRIPIIIIGSIIPNQSIMVSLKPSIIPMDLNHQLVDGFYIPKNNPMKFTVFLIFTKSHQLVQLVNITPISRWFIGDNVNPG